MLPAMKRYLKRLAGSLPGLSQLVFLKGALRGHFYSPVPSLREVRLHRKQIFDVPAEIPGVRLQEQQQLKLIERFAQDYYAEQPFTESFLENDQFRYSDAIVLFCMLRYSRPRMLIEVGSGYSSQVTLETNRRFFDNSIECVFIEPFPSDSLKAAAGNTIVQKRIQDVPLDTFSKLTAGDILFIDSTHVSKVGSDVNHIFFRILPMLRPGVRVHFHDVFYPFEYPEGWILEGKTWNEDYLLRAFLQFNSDFEIELFPNYLMRYHEDFFRNKMPLCLKDPGGSIWLIRR
jgi:hypothetical protein